MENRIEKIMKNYKKELTKIDKKYEVKNVKKPDTKDLENKIKYEKEFIAKLEFQGKELNKEMIVKAKERLELAMSEKAKIDSKYEKDLLKREEKILEKKQLKNSKVVLDSGREVTMAEKDKMDKAYLKNQAIKELISESKSISDTLLAKKAELENKRKEWNEFKYEYEKDENGKLKSEPKNADEIKKIHEEFDNIKKEMIELDKMQKQCDAYLTELKAPTKEDKDFMKAWNDTAKQQKVQSQEEQQGQNQQPQVLSVQEISISASTGKAIVVTEQGEKELNIEEILNNKKELYKNINLKEILKEKGIRSPIARARMKNRVNPVIIKALESDKKMLDEYLDSVIDNDTELPFKYTHNLENSILLNKNERFMNKIALKEEKINGAEVIGAERFHGLKQFFRNAKSKIKAIGKGKNANPELLNPGEEERKSKPCKLRENSDIIVDLDKLEKERIARTEEIYKGLSEEQKQKLSEISIKSNMSEVQMSYRLTYNEAFNLVETYGKKETKPAPQQQPKTTDPDKGENDDTLDL